jgi:hypothetical protein
MEAQNFVSFFIVQGFLVGTVFGILHANSPIELLQDVALITLFFYVVSHISASFYVRYTKVKQRFKTKRHFESMLDRYSNEIKRREVFVNEMYDYIEEIREENRKILQKERERRRKRKAK